jgi:hypothetical protein
MRDAVNNWFESYNTATMYQSQVKRIIKVQGCLLRLSGLAGQAGFRGSTIFDFP